MDWKIFLTIFLSVFIAELGDKTQLATVLFATDRDSNLWLVFLAASSALVVSTAVGVIVGAFLGDVINEKYLQVAAGVGFILIGVYTLARS